MKVLWIWDFHSFSSYQKILWYVDRIKIEKKRESALRIIKIKRAQAEFLGKIFLLYNVYIFISEIKP